MQGANTIFIYAWDVSVANAANTAWIPGRTYMTQFTALISNVNGSNWRGDEYNNYAKFIVHTRDGFMYEVDNNGNAGYRFSFMTNNKGFHAVGDPKTPSYQSIAATTAAQVIARYHDPRTADGNDTYTHKIFYKLPDPTMPERAKGAVPGDSTWLHVPQPELNISTADFLGADGQSDWAAGNKGGFFVFEAKEGMKYEIVISPTAGATFAKKTLTDYVGAEEIRADGRAYVYWDGTDGNGAPLPNGVSPGSVTLQLQGAEVHFPFIDMEVNPNGLKLQLFNPARNGFVSDKVYWDDTAIGSGGGNTGGIPNPINASHTAVPAGQSSAGTGGLTPNGHKWGSSTGPSNGSTFGNNQGMDTWTLAKGTTYTATFNVTIKEADLEVSHLSADKTADLLPGDVITYTVKVKNNGNPDYNFDVLNAPFHFKVPAGFEPADGVFYTFDGNSCGVETGGNSLSFDNAAHTFKSKLNLPKNCEITYTIQVKVTGQSIPGNNTVSAGILRPDDVYDPDGTNISNPEKPLANPSNPIDINAYFYPPTDPFFEAQYNGKSSSNNVKELSMGVKDCEDELIFFENFGISNLNNGNMGRVPSSRMPAGSYTFGNSYLQLPTPGGNTWDDNPIRAQARINDGYYAVVAPQFIDDGWFPDDGWTTWWPNTVPDHTGNSDTETEKGAAMVINAGEVLAPFYERNVAIDEKIMYKASFWFYLLPGAQPTRIAMDILDPKTNELLGTVKTVLMGGDPVEGSLGDTSYIGKWTEHRLYFLTGACTMDSVKVSLRNDFAAEAGNDYFIDDIKLVKWGCEVEEDFFVEVKCPSPVATPDINQTPENTPVNGNVLTNDSGEGITVT